MLDCKKMPHRGLQLTGIEKRDDCLKLNTKRDSERESVSGKIELTPITDQIIRVRFTESDNFVDKNSDSLVPMKHDAHWQIEEMDDIILLKTESIRLEIDRSTCAFTWRNGAGELLVKEPDEGGKVLQPIEVEKIIYDENSELVEEQTIDGLKQNVTGGRKVKYRDAYSSTLRMAFAGDEALYGLGQHEEGIHNYRFKDQYLYQANMKVAVPTLLSTRGYGLHFDTHAFSAFHGEEDFGEFWTEITDQLDFFFIHGPEFDEIISGIRQLTGRPPMHPLWAYGFVQSRERYETQDELIGIVERYRKENVPLDCIVLDWLSWTEGLWGQKSFDPVRFSEPGKMMDDLHERHARLMLSIWPNMRPGGDNQKEMKEKGMLLADDQTYDAFAAEARALYWKQAEEGLFRHGVDAWWCDSSEPYNAEWTGSVKPRTWQRIDINVSEMKKYIDPDMVNAYSLYHARGMYEGQRSTTREKRVVNLTRSSVQSQQRYGTVTWSGDIEARWSRFRMQLAEGLNFTITGNPRWTFDIGAFFVKPGEKWFWDGQYPEGNRDMGYRELYTRWYQAGAFLPMFRSHGTDTPREIWNFGKPGEVFYDTIKAYTELRYRLLPYIYSLAAKEVFHDYTMLRNLAFDFRLDPNTHDISDQFLFGTAFMVCPVTTPMYWEAGSEKLEGIGKTRKVYLPAGTDWYDFWTNRRYQGGQWILADAPLDKMPLYVKAGSLIPMGPVVQYTDNSRGQDLEIRIFPGASGEFTLYEDAGDGYGYEQGEYALTELRWDDNEGRCTIEDRIGKYPGMGKAGKLNPVIVSARK